MQPDLILLDLNLPDIHGIEVLESLRSEPRTAAIPVIILTADATSREAKRAAETGAYAYLTKPFDVAHFLGVVEGAMRSDSRDAA